ncbi:hypothetical protein C818_02375 [Lachnospiraceae bacterium MD308]|jgi:Uncharacterized conserved protein|nr:hypothetical protein C818_02375 [Lachnospiraceae bacterium MD308]
MADYKYQMIITWSDEDQAFLVDVPDLPGCKADGKTVVDAVKNANIVIDEWIEYAKEDGIAIPKPTKKLYV